MKILLKGFEASYYCKTFRLSYIISIKYQVQVLGSLKNLEENAVP